MRTLALVVLVACGGAHSAPPAKTEPVPSVASVTAPTASAQPIVVDAGPPPPRGFKVVKETVHATTQMIARIGNREDASITKPLLATDTDAVCYVATGLTTDMDAKCAAHVEGNTATVEVDFEDDTMQSRSRTHVTMRGTLTIDPSHAILRASFTGQELFQFRTPCEKNDGCENCDPLVKKPGCQAKCFCPFQNVGTADVETSYD